jgi:hypothetical protein
MSSGGCNERDRRVTVLILLAIFIALTFAVGRLLVVAGEPFLQDVFKDQKVTRSVSRLLSVLFYLITLGVLAIDFEIGGVIQTIVVKLGVVLLILGIAYGTSMLVLIRIRERKQAAQISEQVQQKLSGRGVTTQPVTPTVSEPVTPTNQR